MTEKEMVDFVVNHAHDTDEAIREQVRKCWELIVVIAMMPSSLDINIKGL